MEGQSTKEPNGRKLRQTVTINWNQQHDKGSISF